MELIEVSIKEIENGESIPVSFKWRETTVKIESIGREWEIEENHHALVMDRIKKVYHLVFSHRENKWYLLRIVPEFESLA